ncbi:hypothetical protein NVP1081O_229 [Vibrio phage 1.081.O._10N.286.52.C2]|nr:hypothetical protein NVP1081O_229 [Vibrio phage 1.081.O._10N.286.52.C2]
MLYMRFNIAYHSFIETQLTENIMTFNYELALQHLTQSNNPINRLTAMIGAKNFARSDNSVSFKFPATNGVNYAKITLVNDLYNIELGKISNKADPEMKKLGLKVMIPHYKVVTTIEGCFCDTMKSSFESVTGLYLSL